MDLWVYCLGIAKRIYWLAPALLSDPFDIVERWFKVTYELPVWAGWALVGMGIFIAGFLTYREQRRIAKTVATRAEVIERQANQGLPLTDIPFEWLSKDGQERRLAQARHAILRMSIFHGHADENGIMEAVRTGTSFNTEPCWLCGRARFGWREGNES